MKRILFFILLSMSLTCFGQDSLSIDTRQTNGVDSIHASHTTFSSNTLEDATKAEGDSAYIKEDYAAAIQIYEALLKNGEAADVYYNLGNSYYKIGEIAKAVLNYERALLLQPGNGVEMLLKQTEGLGINIYTHGEMLPSHGYEGLKKYKHLAGNFGGAWQDQQKQFDNLPGCILMTTNCLMRPRDTYKDRIYSTNVVGWDGIKYIEKKPDGEKDFSEIIKQSLELGGFTEEQEAKEILVGFGHEAALSHAGELVEAVKSKQIRHFFLIGGCDGARPGRSYFTDFATMVPDDCMILTLACGKYRFNKLDFGTVAGLPRLLDIGQCNDVYSAILIANALADAFDTDVNGLPLSLIVSWYEQKAVADLLALLSLGIKNIYLGPTLPAFLSPNVLQYLVDTFQLRLISNPEDDIKTCLGQAV